MELWDKIRESHSSGRFTLPISFYYSHSIVAGGFEEMS